MHIKSSTKQLATAELQSARSSEFMRTLGLIPLQIFVGLVFCIPVWLVIDLTFDGHNTIYRYGLDRNGFILFAYHLWTVALMISVGVGLFYSRKLFKARWIRIVVTVIGFLPATWGGFGLLYLLDPTASFNYFYGLETTQFAGFALAFVVTLGIKKSMFDPH